MGVLKETVENITPAELARIRGKRQNLSSRYKETLLNKIIEVESVFDLLGIEIFLKKVEK